MISCLRCCSSARLWLAMSWFCCCRFFASCRARGGSPLVGGWNAALSGFRALPGTVPSAGKTASPSAGSTTWGRPSRECRPAGDVVRGGPTPGCRWARLPLAPRYLSTSSWEWAKVQCTPRGQEPLWARSRQRLVLYLPWGGASGPGLPPRPPKEPRKPTRPCTTAWAASTLWPTSSQDASGLGSSAASSSRCGLSRDRLPGSPVRCSAITSSWTLWPNDCGLCSLSMMDCMCDLWAVSPYSREDHCSGAMRRPASVAICTIWASCSLRSASYVQNSSLSCISDESPSRFDTLKHEAL
uniref:Secreted protein n=1 Tax=Ixodes ricinus TaxID=34613 RepID=A0A147BE13_IXORI